MESDPFELKRFLAAQSGTFDGALEELRAGAKQGHWMWFVFPQIAGLGLSPMSQHYAIRSLDEARAYAAHPQLGPRLRQSIEAILGWAGKRGSVDLLGPVDARKLRSSLTLFALATDEPLFKAALDAFYGGPDPETLRLAGPC